MYRCRLLAACAALLVTVITTPARAHPVRDPSTGPSTSTPPYVIPVADGVHIKTLLTVDDDGAASDGYELTGTPDGLGVTKTDRNHFSVFMNHEFNALTGTEHRHGQKGAYVSTFRVDRRDFEVVEGEDTIDPGVRYWDYVSRRYQATASVGGANPRSPGDTFPAQGDARRGGGGGGGGGVGRRRRRRRVGGGRVAVGGGGGGGAAARRRGARRRAQTVGGGGGWRGQGRRVGGGGGGGALRSAAAAAWIAAAATPRRRRRGGGGGGGWERS